MKIFVTSDHHFLHQNIIKYCSRPFKNEYEMNEFMITSWNETVSKDDIVFHLGDLFAGIQQRYDEAKNILNSLNGKIYLIEGNHDWLEDRFYLSNNVFEKTPFKIINDNILLVHYNIHQKEFYDTYNIERFNIFKMIYADNNCKYLLHGHSHMTPSTELNTFNVSVDLNDFKPVLIDDIFKNVFFENSNQKDFIDKKLLL